MCWSRVQKEERGEPGSLKGKGEERPEKSKIPGNVLKGMGMGEEDADPRDIGNIRGWGKGRTGQQGAQCLGCGRPTSAGARPFQRAGEAGSRPRPRSRKVGAARGRPGWQRPLSGWEAPGSEPRGALPSGRRWSKPSRGRAPGCSPRTSPAAAAPARGSNRSADGTRCPRPGPRREPGTARAPAPTPGPARPPPPPPPRAAAGWAAAGPEGRSSLGRARRGPRVRTAEKFCCRRAGSFFLQESRRKIKTFRKSPRAGGGRGDEDQEGRGWRENGRGGRIAPPGARAARGGGVAARRSSSRGARGGTGRRVSEARAPGGGGEGGARGGEGELGAGTAEPPPGRHRSRKSRGRAAAVAAGFPVAAPSARGSWGLSLPWPEQDRAAGPGAASAGVVRPSPPGLRSPLARLPDCRRRGRGAPPATRCPGPRASRSPQSPPPLPNVRGLRTSTSEVTCAGPKNAQPCGSPWVLPSECRGRMKIEGPWKPTYIPAPFRSPWVCCQTG